MSYQIEIQKPALKFITKLPKNEKEHLLREISKLPEGSNIKALKGKKSKGFYRLRVGAYRIIYTVDHGKLVVCVIDAGNRGEIYSRY